VRATAAVRGDLRELRADRAVGGAAVGGQARLDRGGDRALLVGDAAGAGAAVGRCALVAVLAAGALSVRVRGDAGVRGGRRSGLGHHHAAGRSARAALVDLLESLRVGLAIALMLLADT